jgi:hypothetical protein
MMTPVNDDTPLTTKETQEMEEGLKKGGKRKLPNG